MSGANDLPTIRQGSDQPIDITSKKLFARKIAGGREVKFDGNVRIKQGGWTLTCERLVTLWDEDKRSGQSALEKKPPKNLQTANPLKSVTAIGNVTYVQESLKAIAGQGLFDNAKRTVTLREGPRVWQGPHMMGAHTIIIYLDENRYEAWGEDGRPLTVTIFPGKHKKDKEK
jgi:lipopolysaccharide export system protein LptA